MTARYAIYFAPAQHTALWRIGCTWLGRDARTDTPIEQPTVPGLSSERVRALTASARLYGWHATLKPPFVLADGKNAQMLIAAAQGLAARIDAFALPPLAVDTLSGFIALRAEAENDELRRLCDTCVTQLDPFRRPAPPEELENRRAAGLSARQDALLARFGYPYVMEEWRFHMTLTERVVGPERGLLLSFLTRLFESALSQTIPCDAISLFGQAHASDPFVLLERFPLRHA